MPAETITTHWYDSLTLHALSKITEAVHEDQKLGIRIAPSQVRLQPRPEDPYMWSFPPSKSHLFKTSLSQGTTGLYEQICEELNRSIEAVPWPEKTDAVVRKVRVHSSFYSNRRVANGVTENTVPRIHRRQFHFPNPTAYGRE